MSGYAANGCLGKKITAAAYSSRLLWIGRRFASCHVGKAFHGFCEALDGLVGVAMLDAIPDAMLDMAFQHHLAAAMQR